MSVTPTVQSCSAKNCFLTCLEHDGTADMVSYAITGSVGCNPDRYRTKPERASLVWTSCDSNMLVETTDQSKSFDIEFGTTQ